MVNPPLSSRSPQMWYLDKLPYPRAPQPSLKPKHQVLRLELEVRQSGGVNERVVPARRAFHADEIARPEILDASCVEGNHVRLREQ
jgi:hypothetical protein